MVAPVVTRRNESVSGHFIARVLKP
jgi:hypothetical protein